MAWHLPSSVVGEVFKQVTYSSKKIGGYLLAVFMLLGTAAIASTTAQAQYPGGYGQDRYRNDRYRNDRYNNNAYQIARQQGYRNGLSTGASDAQRGQSYSPQRSHFWRNGTDGYSGSYGANRGQFKQVFRDAFVQGYREGYQRYAYNNRRGNNGRWGNGRWPN
jgi:hypothetical protein